MRVISQPEWLSALLDPRRALRVDNRYYGEAVRTDGWWARRRYEPWHIIYLALEGRSRGATEQGDDITFEAGQVLWLPPHTVHDIYWTPTFRYEEIWFHLGDRDEVSPVARPLVVPGAAEVRPLFERLGDEIAVQRPLRSECLRTYLAALCVELFRLAAAEGGGRRGLSALQREVVTRYTQAHLSEGIAPAQLAATVTMTPDYFARVFRASFGCSPRVWLTRERARAASRLLAGSNLRVAEIARRLGYGDMPQFSRQFKAVMGMTPRAFRQTAAARTVAHQVRR
jgi:AraC-like DNA-binding protein